MGDLPQSEVADRLWVCGVVCPVCRVFVFSRAPHDYRSCPCGEVAVDGGLEYTRVSFRGPAPGGERRPVEQTRRQLWDDWNTSADLYGLVFPLSPVEVLATASKESTNV